MTPCLCRGAACSLLLLVSSAWGSEPLPELESGKLEQAVMRGLRVVQMAASNYPSHRSCFSCHHQTLPMLAMVTARDRDMTIDNQLLSDQADFTHKSFQGRVDRMKEGEGVGGTSMTVGYGLWALDLANRRPDATTDAMVAYLLKQQKPDGHWARYTSRPPLEDSNITCTVLAAYYMGVFASDAQRPQVDAAMARARSWLLAATPKSQEDFNSRLLGLSLLETRSDEIRAARKAVLEAQREDGGWAQLPEMKSDAYATGQTLFALQESGLPTSDPAYQRGARFLLDSQCEDGSWFVKSRSKPIQTLFDNGDPHGKNGFISVPATSWAAAALAALKDKREAKVDGGSAFQVVDGENEIKIISPTLEAVIRKRGYVSGVAGGSFLDKKTGYRDVGFGLDIVDWLLEPGSDAAYRDELQGRLAYNFNNLVHGKRAKRSIEGPQICTRARELSPRLIRGKDFVAVKSSFKYHLAAPGKKTGSLWEQTIVFPAGKRYFISSDRITTVNSSEAMFLRIDMPGHIKHKSGDTFSEIYLSYVGRIPSRKFFEDFPPDERFNYRRDERTGEREDPRRFIRAYRLRDRESGAGGPWLAGMTLDPDVVHEAWCHQRGYVCMIEEVWGRPVKPGDSFEAVFLVGYFDSIDEMHQAYDEYAGATGLQVDESGWKLVKR